MLMSKKENRKRPAKKRTRPLAGYGGPKSAEMKNYFEGKGRKEKIVASSDGGAKG